MKRLILDIETRPLLAYSWGVWQVNIHPEQIVQPKDVISVAAKWHGSTEMMFYSDFHTGHRKMIRKVWKLLDEADAVIHYNGVKFDVPHLQHLFYESGMTPPSPFHQIDLLKTVRKRFQFSHNKLDVVAVASEIGKKVEHEGFGLWLKCLARDPEAWERMRTYNEHDVELTEALYDKLLPWIPNHPSHAARHGDIRCTNCGSERLRYKGYQYTKTRRYKRFTCKDCGTHVHDAHCDQSAPVTPTSW